jgi:alpha-L-fucosidase
VPYIGASGPSVISALQHGDPNGTVWRPAEVDVSIRPGWFNHPADDAKVRSVENLVELYFTSVGRNAKLLLNVPPTAAGLLHETDEVRLRGFHDRLAALFANDLTSGGAGRWTSANGTPAELVVNLRRRATVSMVRLEERIVRGQMVSGFTLYGAADDGDWQVLTRGTTIGHARLLRLVPATVQRVRLVIDGAVAPPEPITLRLYGS